jgi:rhodanese-related sulfurtransferase
MKTYMQMVAEIAKNITEVFPWDVEGKTDNYPIILDIREPYEFEAMRIEGSINVPRGVLESACEWNYEETVPELVNARDVNVLVVCRSGHRSVLACDTMQKLGYENVASLKTGLRGWFEYELELVDNENSEVSEDDAEKYFESHVEPHQLKPTK